MKQFKAKEGASFGNDKAQVYGQRLELIESTNGKLTPQLVVKDAKEKASPLHNHFEWDDKKASDKFRLAQARLMINHIVEVVVVEGKPMTIKSWFNVKDVQQEPIYVTVQEAVKTPSYSTQVLNELIQSLEYITNLMKTFKKLVKK